MTVLGIETSCDETAVALYGDKGLALNNIRSQDEAHRPYGGVVPEVASREHINWLMPMVDQALAETDSRIDAIAYTAGPGLAGCLVVGASVANATAYSLGQPVLPVNHLEGHLLSPLIENGDLEFPYLCLLATGGHTQLVQVDSLHNYRLVGSTLDDAVGECFDKVGFQLGISYPAGAKLETLADKGDENAYSLPVPMAGNQTLDFSFSGLKTAAIRLHEGEGTGHRQDVAASFQRVAAEGLAIKTERAMDQFGATRLAVVGGVSRNRRIRDRLQQACDARGSKLFTCSASLCIDNAAMIAFTAYRLMKAGLAEPVNPAAGPFDIRPRWPVAVRLADA